MIIKRSTVPALNKLLAYLRENEADGVVQVSSTQVGEVLGWGTMKAHRMLKTLERIQKVTIKKGVNKFIPSTVTIVDGNDIDPDAIMTLEAAARLAKEEAEKPKLAGTPSEEIAGVTPEKIEKLIKLVYDQKQEIDKIKAESEEKIAELEKRLVWAEGNKESVRKHGETLDKRISDALAVGGEE